MEFVKRFEGPVGMRKRVYRFGKQNDWQFSGGVFVTFDTRDNALRLVSLFIFFLLAVLFQKLYLQKVQFGDSGLEKFLKIHVK